MKEKLRKFALKSFRTVEDLPDVRANRFTAPIQHERRKQIKIAVIDDQPFEAGVNLRNFGYEIREIGDVKKISEVSNYPIVLCDLMDVGLHFDRTNQGAALIKEIRKNYPAVLVAAYSGSAMTAEPVKKAKQFADGFIKKDAEIETWVEELDRLISLATNARTIWLRTRKALVEEQIDTRTLLTLEDAYVRSLAQNDTDFKILTELATSSSVGDAASNIIYGLITSTIFRVLIGS